MSDTAPDLWENLQHLMDNVSKCREADPSRIEFYEEHVVTFIRDKLRMLQFSPDQILRVLVRHTFIELHKNIINNTSWQGIMNTNNVNLNLKSGQGTGLYPLYARLNHGCICNTKTIKFEDHRYIKVNRNVLKTYFFNI